MSETYEAFPLSWPIGRKRTERWNRERSNFDVSFARARDNITKEVVRMVGRYGPDPQIIISTNIALRRDGLPLANQREPEDPGVAVYFLRKKKQMSFACDRWDKVQDNMQAIVKTIDALRGIERWGSGDMLEAAFTGFTALPAPGGAKKTWHEVFGIPAHTSTGDVEVIYRRQRSEAHPDRPGGSHERMAAVNVAWDQFKTERGLI